MKIEHDGKSYDFDMDSVQAHELRLVEQYTGMTFSEWATGLQRGKVDALVAIVFVAKRRAGDDVEWSDLDDLDVAELVFAMAEANGVDMDAVARGEIPDMPVPPPNRAARRAKPAAKAPVKRPAAAKK